MGLICLLSACIKNDLPYPYIVGEIAEMEVRGQTAAAKIDVNKRTVELTVDEDELLDSIVVTKFVATAEARIYPDSLSCRNALKYPTGSFTSLADLPAAANTAIDFRKPVAFLLQTYQDYYWKISVTQVIDRTISVENQVGEPVVDYQNHIVVIYVDAEQPLDDITIHKLNVEGSKTRLVPDPATVKDFTRPQRFKAYRGDRFISEWLVDVLHTQRLSTTGEAEVWARKATLNGAMKQGAAPVVEYRKETESDWTTLPADAVTLTSATTFKAQLTGLTDGTAYRWRILVNGTPGDEASFTTETIVEIPNLNFDTWTKEGNNWFANPVADDYDSPQAYWATGNEGVTSTLAGGRDPITVPVEGAEAYKGKAAKMVTLTGVPLVGAAAGNLFIGRYKTNMSKPSASAMFGRPYTGARPTGLKGYYKYVSKPVNHGTYPGTLTMDECHVYVRLWDEQGTLFATGEFVGTENMDTYTEFKLDFVYTDLKAKPAKLAIVATSSHYGGEFDGAKVVGQVGEGSTMWVDEFELLYD